MSMEACFWCGTVQPRNPKADLIPTGSQNARYAPCETCEGRMSLGVTIVEVSDKEAVEFQVGMHLGDGRLVYPTGLWAVVPQSFVKKFQGELSDVTGGYGFCMVSPGVWDLMELER